MIEKKKSTGKRPSASDVETFRSTLEKLGPGFLAKCSYQKDSKEKETDMKKENDDDNKKKDKET